jgi:foldase protein PrsA
MKRVAVTLSALALLCILAASLLAAGCGSGVPNDAVATVGGTSITKAQLQELLAQAKIQVQSQGSTFPAEGTASYDAYLGRIVDYLVQSEVISQSAGKLGVSVTDAEVNAQVAQIVKSYGGEKKVLALLKQQGMTMALLKESMRDQTLAQRVAAKVVAKATVSDAQIQAYWQAHAAALGKQKKTATLAKAKTTIRQTLLTQAKQTMWTAWLKQRSADLSVEYATGYAPAELTASPSASAPASAGG